MTHVMLFHHAQGLTAGVHAFADRLRAAGHVVTTPDLYEGRVFATLDEGVAHAEVIGIDVIADLGVAAAASMPEHCVFGGFSLGAVPAQRLAQQRPGTLGALLYHGGIAPSWFSPSWPTGVHVQVHGASDDPWMEWDDLTELLVEMSLAQSHGHEYRYPGSAHLFTDSSLDEYDAAATDLVIERSLEFLELHG